MWIARDRDDTLVKFENKPKRDEWYGFWCESGSIPYSCNDVRTSANWRAIRPTAQDLPRYRELSWDDDPIEVEFVPELNSGNIELDYAYMLGFAQGEKNAEDNISTAVINRVIDLFYEANKEVRLHMVDGGMSMEKAREMQVNYIQKHWKNYENKAAEKTEA